MNKNEFLNYMFEEFPSVFDNSFAIEMLENILNYAESIGDKNIQYLFLSKMIPQISEYELKKLIL